LRIFEIENLKSIFTIKLDVNAIITLITTLIIFVGCSIIMFLLLGIDPIVGVGIMFVRPFFSEWGLSETIMRTSFLLLPALGIALAIRAGFWNIGADGQMYMGALAATGIGIYIAPHLPAFILWPLILIASSGAGAAWASVPALLKVKRGVNEILTTIMMNFVAIWIVHYFALGPWHESGAFLPRTWLVHPSARLPILIAGTRAHAGIFIGLAATIGLFFLLKYTVFGFQVKVSGSKPTVAQYAAISLTRTVMIVALIAGGLAGLGGMDHILGVHHYLLNGGYKIMHYGGYLALVPALLANVKPALVLPATFTFAGFITGAHMLSVRFGLPGETNFLFVGILLMLALFREVMYRRSKWTR
jgi:simple sugar transport system permease protein